MGYLHYGILLDPKKGKFYPLWPGCMDGPGNIMLSEISQRKANAIWFHSHVESNEQMELKSKMSINS